MATLSAYEKAYGSPETKRAFNTRTEDEAVRRRQPNPGRWYVWQMNDEYFHISLETRFQGRAED